MQPTDWNIAQFLAHSVVFFAREQAVGVELFAGSPPAPESTSKQIQAYIKDLPQLLQTTAQNVLPVEQALLAAQQQIAPGKNQLEADLYRQFGPQFAQIASDIQAQTAQNTAKSDLALLQGPGKELSAAAIAAQREADPEYFAARELGLSGLQNLFSQIPTGNELSGSERAEVDRSLAQSNYARGNEAPTALSTVSNAMQFGKAGEERAARKQQQIAQAVNTATGFLSPAKSNIDVMQLTTGRPSFNTGEQRMSSPSQLGDSTFGMGQQFLGQTGANARQQSAAQTSAGSLLGQIGQGFGVANDACCWIFLAANGGALPPHVRLCRNVLGTPEIREGYRRMSRWLVPAMRHSRFVQFLVEATMTYPMTQYGGWLTSTPGYSGGFVFRPIKRFWFAVWNKLGQR